MFRVTVTGRFDTDKILKEVTDRALQLRLKQAQQQIRHLHCAEHGKPATVTLIGSGPKRMLNISGCCDAFAKKARAAITKQ